MNRAFHALWLPTLIALVLATVLTVPASAKPHRVTVWLSDGPREVVLDVPSETRLQDVPGLVPAVPHLYRVTLRLPDGSERVLVLELSPESSFGYIEHVLGGELVAIAPVAPAPAAGERPSAGDGQRQRSSGDGRTAKPRAPRARRKRNGARRRSKVEAPARLQDRPALRGPARAPARRRRGFADALAAPPTATGWRNPVIRSFTVPPFLLPIYQAAGVRYGIRWEVLAAINEIETDYGRNLGVSSAGALGWMQFLPSSWRAYGVDANRDGRRDPYNPVDAIFAAARYLAAAGYEDDPRRAIFAYNHADWYVDSVMLRARLIAGVPADLVGSLTGLTAGRFPVYAPARYAGGQGVYGGARRRRGVEIFARRGAPLIAVNDGVVAKIGRSKRLGRYVVLRDVYGNRYTYARLGKVASHHPVPKGGRQDPLRSPRAVRANERGSVPIKDRLFARPGHPLARRAGGLEQLLDAKARRDGSFEAYTAYFSKPFALDEDDLRLRRLKAGSRVIGGTVLGRIGRTVERKAPHLYFEIRPAGGPAPRIDPEPILDGWQLLEQTAVYRASGRNVLHGLGAARLSLGQALLLPKRSLERRVLSDERIEVYACGRRDIRSGRIDRRVLASLLYLADSGLSPTVTSLECGHSYYTSSGNVSHHSSGNAVDIAKLNGIPVSGHQEPGGVTDQAVRQLLRLPGAMRPAQVISLLDRGGASFAMADHHDHIHVGFSPLSPGRAGRRQAFEPLHPGQWSNLLAHVRRIENPRVPARPSRYALPVRGRR